MIVGGSTAPSVIVMRSPVERAMRLEYLTVGWNTFEVFVTIALGVASGSLALVAFGLDSLVEIFASGTVLVAAAPRRCRDTSRDGDGGGSVLGARRPADHERGRGARDRAPGRRFAGRHRVPRSDRVRDVRCWRARSDDSASRSSTIRWRRKPDSPFSTASLRRVFLLLSSPTRSRARGGPILWARPSSASLR